MTSYITGLIVEKKKIGVITIGVGEQISSSTGVAPPTMGDGSISGKTSELGLPVSRRVMLYERKTGRLFGKTWSDTNGNYKFNRTNEATTYFAIAVDENNDDVQYNLVGQDLLSGNHDKDLLP